MQSNRGKTGRMADPHQQAPQPHTIVLSVDGLRASALGAYGNTAYETPALDSLAAKSKVWDWCYADRPDLAGIYKAIDASLDHVNDPFDPLLVSDCQEMLTTSFAKRFAQSIEIEPPNPTENADSIGQTLAAQTWAMFAQAIACWKESNESGRLFAWLHTQGMYGPWDAPTELYSSLVDEDDPRLEPTVAVPDTMHDDPSSSEACDARFAASCRYAAQAMVLDACLEGWLDVVQGLFEGEELQIILLGTRGFPLGEHGRVGGVDERLFSEQQQVPLLVSALDPKDRFSRTQKPTTLSTMLANLICATDDPTKAESAVILSSQSGYRSLRTSEWLLRVDSTEEASLYVKPDDRWEQNDIASLRPEEVDEMLDLLSRDLGSES